MVRAGEHAGFLEDVLADLSSFLERQDDLRSKVHGAMIYPLLLAGFAVVIVMIILIFLVPKFQAFLTDVPLPLPSQILFAVSDAVRNQAVLLAGGAVLLVLAGWSALRSETGRKLWSAWQLRLPAAGRAIRMVAITRFCRVLGTMLANGVQILQALTISKDATGNELMAQAVQDAADNVRAGETLSEPLRRSGFFPPETMEMIAVAEESNQLDRVLVQLADTVERRTNRQVDAAVRLIEPLLLMIMAGAIGFIAVGLLYPIFTLAQTLR
jgi:general secretion pathway protein F/type IV pilus assembly protein PilC